MTMLNAPQWSGEEKDILAANINKISFKEITELLPGRTIDAVKRRADMLGLQRTGRHFPWRMINESFFSAGGNLAAYWAGFIAADGCIVTEPRREVRLKLHVRDIEHVKNFIAVTGYDGTLKQSGDFCGITLCAADRWIHDLQYRYRIGPRKTKTLEPPLSLDHTESLAYSIGYIDGDGCWHRDRCNGRLHLIVVGTEATLQWFNDIWSVSGATVGNTSSRLVKGIYRRSWSGSHAESIAKLLSTIDVPFLKRKWDIANGGQGTR